MALTAMGTEQAGLIAVFGPFLFMYLGNRIGRTASYRTEHLTIFMILPFPVLGVSSVLMDALFKPWVIELGYVHEDRWLILGVWCVICGLIGALSALNKRVKQQYTIEFVAGQDQELKGQHYERGDTIEVVYFESQRRRDRAAKMLRRYRRRYRESDSSPRLLDLTDWPELNWRVPSTDDWTMTIGLAVDEDTRYRMLVTESDIKALCDSLPSASDPGECISMFFHNPKKWENWYTRRSGKGRRRHE